MVVDTLASGGVANTICLAANILGLAHGHCCNFLLAGGLSALQTVTIASALPSQ